MAADECWKLLEQLTFANENGMKDNSYGNVVINTLCLQVRYLNVEAFVLMQKMAIFG